MQITGRPALPSRAANTGPDWIRSAGVLICLAMVPLMFAALRQSTDSRKFLGHSPNKKFFTVKKTKIKLYAISSNFLLQTNIIEKYTI
jgi:hypothetical protein